MNTKIVFLVSIVAVILAHECYSYEFRIEENTDRDLDVDNLSISAKESAITKKRNSIVSREAINAYQINSEKDLNTIDANNFYKTIDISNSRKLLEIFKQLIDNINVQLVGRGGIKNKSQGSETIDTINENISNLLVGLSNNIEGILKENKDIILDKQQEGPIKELYSQISRTLLFYKTIIERSKSGDIKTTHITSFENYQKHPVKLAIEYFQYFIDFSYHIYKTNEYLKQHEKVIRDYHNIFMNLYAELGAEVPIDQGGMIKVGSNMKLEQGIVNNARGTQSKTSIGLNSSIKADIGAIAIKGNLGGTYSKQKDAVGMKSSSQMVGMAKDLKGILLKMPLEYKTFSDQRTVVDGLAKDLSANLSGLQKLFNMYSNINRTALSKPNGSSNIVKIVYKYIDPKSNLEKSKSIEVSKSVEVSSSLSKLLSLKLSFDSKSTIHTKDKNVFDLISKIDFSRLLGDYSLLKKMAILFKKYDVIKKAYIRDGEVDTFRLRDLFESHCRNKNVKRSIFRSKKKTDSFVTFSELVATVSYYAEILENLSPAKIKSKSKDEIKRYHKAKQEIEKKFATNGRAKTFAEMYFMGIGYLVLGMNDQSAKRLQQTSPNRADIENYNRKIAELKNSYEKIALFLSESNDKTKKAMKSMQCFSTEDTISIDLADGLFSFNIKNISDSPYIFENGFDIIFDIDISKLSKLYKKIKQIRNGIKMSKEMTNKVQLFLNSSENDTLRKLALLIDCIELEISTVKNAITKEMKRRYADMDSARIARVVDSINRILPIIQTAFQRVSSNEKKMRAENNLADLALIWLNAKKSSKASFVYKNLGDKALGLLFLGVKLTSSISNEFNMGTNTIVSGTPIETTFKIGMKRSVDGGFVYRNSSSIFMLIKDIVDYCFIREADFGEEVKGRDIKEFLRSIYGTDYLSEVYKKYKENRLTSELLRLKSAVMCNSYSLLEKSMSIPQIPTNEYLNTSNTEDQFIDMLIRFGLHMFKEVAKPYTERIYIIKNGTKAVRL